MKTPFQLSARTRAEARQAASPSYTQPGPETLRHAITDVGDCKESCAACRKERNALVERTFAPLAQPGPETCGAVHESSEGVARCNRRRGHPSQHAMMDLDGAPIAQWSQPVSEDEGRGPCERCAADPTVQPGLCECRAGASSGRLLKAAPIRKPTEGRGPCETCGQRFVNDTPQGRFVSCACAFDATEGRGGDKP